MKCPSHHFSNSFFCSFSQIMLQGNAVTGFLFCIGIGLNSPQMLLGGIIATLAGLATATMNRYDSASIQNGVYSYNASLVGIAVLFFFPASLFSLSLAIFAGAFATVITHLMLIRIPGISVLTAPFIISTWLILLVFDNSQLANSGADVAANITGDFYSLMRGISQVMFQDYWLSGGVFIFGLLFHSFKATAWAVIGSALGILTARVLGFSEELLLMGMYGFNACLVAISLAERYNKHYSPIVLGIILSVLLSRVFEQITLPALTAPFVLSSWIILGFIRRDTNVQTCNKSA
ncbi:urea transporter [Thalassotalea nanhaiensis]|uniref:Urea transporter n=1 Tax=Thalassotalea nanhaiensis TaxID=3065648 RepID=A0ABY9TJ92_9GAMM|nr:urea transporter [Colwelliaceae bacterium SQ345]